jgi:phosphatidylinositol dimannoside acyltransferase
VAVKRTPRLSTRLLLAGLEGLSAAAGVIPRHAVAEPLCRAAGVLWYLAAPAAREAVFDNLSHVLGHPPTRRQIVAVFENGALNYWDTFAIPHFSQRDVLDLVDLHGTEHLLAAREQGRGAILCTAHLGSVSLVGQVLPALGYELTGLLEPIEPRELYEFFARRRQALGARMLPVGASALRELLRALRRNELLGLVTDRDLTGSGPMIRFFDAPASFPDGAAALAVRSGAPILIAVCTRKSGGRFDGWIHPLPAVALSGKAKQDILALTQAIASGLQYHIASHPEQWTVFQKRWPDAPPRR